MVRGVHGSAHPWHDTIEHLVVAPSGVWVVRIQPHHGEGSRD
jgi:hypothetical protein